MKPFFKNANFKFGTEPYRYTSSRSMPPISIGDKESKVVHIELTVEFYDWKKHFDHKPVSKDRIAEVLCQADGENKQRFSDFCATLRSGMHIGKISIKSHQTTGWRFRRSDKIRERTLVDDEHIGALDEKLIGNFRSWEKKWDATEPDVVLTELRQVCEHFDRELCKPVEKNLKILTRMEEIGSLETDILDTVKGRLHGDETRIGIVDFVLRSAQLDSRLKEYDSRTKEWNRKLSLVRDDPPRLEELLRAHGPSLGEETERLGAEIASLQMMLRECYIPS